MFERFTERARQVVVLAQEEARTLKHNYIGTEHILLGLIHEGEDLETLVEQELRQVRADESGPAGDQSTHAPSTLTAPAGRERLS